jgi:hypothetical protein
MIADILLSLLRQQEYIQRTLVTMNMWMWVIRQMNFAIDICEGKMDCPEEDEFCAYDDISFRSYTCFDMRF